jgi:hypothetical protein
MPMGGSRLTAEAWIDVFSGRPAPRWALTDGESQELLSILARLAPEAVPPRSADLGYRGVNARLPGRSDFDVLRAGNGVVVFEPPERHALADPERRVERFLWESAQRHLPAAVTAPLESHSPPVVKRRSE